MKLFQMLMISALMSHGALLAEDEVTAIPDLVCSWNFSEASGEMRVSTGKQHYGLEEVNGPIKRVEGRGKGTHAVRIKAGQYFRIAEGDFKAIDFHGPDAQFTIVARVRRQATSHWQAVAGIWNETQKKRQYCLFLNASTRSDSRTMSRIPTKDEVHGHVSDVGGPTEGKPFCITYSSSGTKVPLKEWTLVAMTFDGKASRVYVNGKFSAEEGYNPYPLEGGIFDGDAEFTVGAVDRGGEIGNYLNGEIDELAIYSRALTEGELQKLAASSEK